MSKEKNDAEVLEKFENDISFIVHLTLTGVDPDTVWDRVWLRSNLESLLNGMGVKADVSVVKMLKSNNLVQLYVTSLRALRKRI